MLHYETIHPNTLELLRKIQSLELLVVFHGVCPRWPRRIERQVAELQEHSKHNRKKESLFVPAQVLGLEKIPVTYIAGIFPAELVKRFVGLVS